MTTKEKTLATLIGTLVIGSMATAVLGGYSPTLTPPPNAHEIRILEIQRDAIHCPEFLDAPLGNKACPAKEEIDAAIKILKN